MLSTHSLSRSFGKKRVLDKLDAQFPVGLTLLTGPSGAGKSTLLRLLATADRPDGGQVHWQGERIDRTPRPYRAIVGYAPQAVELPETLTGREFGAHVAALKGLEARAADSQFAQILERMRLLPDIDRRIQGWSGGMRRRLITAQALLGEPQAIFLDEPTAELDAESAAITHELLIERASQAVVVMTTHLAKDLLVHAAQVLRIEGGAAPPVKPATA